MKIAVVGLWHLGEVYSACLAELGHKVIGVSEDSKVVSSLNKGVLPLPEPKLTSILKKNLKNKRLSYTSDFSSLGDCEILWLTIDTPIDEKDRANLAGIFETLKNALAFIKKDILIVVSSQLPVGTSAKIVQFIKEQNKKLKFEYAYVPENLRLGEAVECFFNPGRIVVGAEKVAYKKVRLILRKLKTNFLHMSVISSEMVKHATNSFLATSLSFIYDIADVCEKAGADVADVAGALRSDHRIGPQAYLDASVGFSGGTLGRDLQYLLAEARRHEIKLPVIRSVLSKNVNRKEIVYQKLEQHLEHFRGKRIGFFGVTYKAGTSALRRSLPLEIALGFIKRGAKITIFDPHIKKDNLRSALRGVSYEFSKNPYEAASNCHVLAFITPWLGLRKLDFAKIYNCMEPPAVFFDARNFFYKKQQMLETIGFKYIGVGR